MKKIKVCGLRDNFQEIVQQVKPDFAGMIFYPPSPRYIPPEASPENFTAPSGVKKIGVFVNESIPEILRLAKRFDFAGVQLHGDESPEDAQRLKNEGLLVIKAFRVREKEDLVAAEDFSAVVDFLLFDAKGKSYGGNGIRFDWDLLKTYTTEKPFFLSGGILPNHATSLQQLKLDHLYGFDLNSGFETAPALKSSTQLQQFLTTLNLENA